MKEMISNEIGTTEVVEQVEKAKHGVKKGNMDEEVKAKSVNHIDTMQRSIE